MFFFVRESKFRSYLVLGNWIVRVEDFDLVLEECSYFLRVK